MRTLEIKNFPYEAVRIKTIGDGSCLYHSIFQAYNKTYRDSSSYGKKIIIKKLVKELSNLLSEKQENGKTYYENLSRGIDLSQFSYEVGGMKCDYSLEGFKKHLRYGEWGDQRTLELISNILDLDIYIINAKTKDLYITGDREIYIKDRNSIIIYYINDMHFETIGIKSGGGVITYFSKNNPIIQELKKRYPY